MTTLAPIMADITDESSVKALFAQVEAQVGRLDLLFNNAGTAAAGLPIDEVPSLKLPSADCIL